MFDENDIAFIENVMKIKAVNESKEYKVIRIEVERALKNYRKDQSSFSSARANN